MAAAPMTQDAAASAGPFWRRPPWLVALGSGIGTGRASTLPCAIAQLRHSLGWAQTKAAKSLNGDVFRGTAFSWMVTAMMVGQMLPTALPVFALLGFSLLETMAVQHTVGVRAEVKAEFGAEVGATELR